MAESLQDRRDRVWDIALDLGSWSHGALCRAAGLSGTECDRVIEDWLETGHVVRTDAPSGAPSYRCNPEAEGERRTRTWIGTDTRESSAHDNMWRAIRRSGPFTARDLAMLSSTPRVVVTEEMAAKYAQMLTKAGYLRAVRKATARQPAVYRLIANTGPLPPVERRVRCIFDPNKKALTHVPGRQSDV